MKNKLLKGLSLLPIIIGLVLVNIPTNKQVNKVDNKKFAFYLNDTESDVAPSKDSGYVFEKAECKTESGNNSDVVISWDNDTWSANVSNIKSKGVKCSIYFTKNGIAKGTPFTITLDGQGTDNQEITEKYQEGAYSEGGSAITKITPPVREGYEFGGYYTGVDGAGEQIIDKDGNINLDKLDFVSNTTLYAKWIPIRKTLTVNKDSNIKSVTGSGTYACGTQVTVTATPKDTEYTAWSNPAERPTGEYQFRNRTKSVYSVTSISGVTATKNNNSFTFTMPCSDTIVTVNGSKTDTVEKQESTLESDTRVWKDRDRVKFVWVTTVGNIKSVAYILDQGATPSDVMWTPGNYHIYATLTGSKIHISSDEVFGSDNDDLCLLGLNMDAPIENWTWSENKPYEYLYISDDKDYYSVSPAFENYLYNAQCYKAGVKLNYELEVGREVVSGSATYKWIDK